MPLFSWLAQENELSNAALTVRAQAISPNDVGRLYYPSFFPISRVDSVKLADISTLDFRPVADRREWGARGRLIPLKTPPTRLGEMIPIESYFKIEELEIQLLEERVAGNQALFRQLIGASIPSRTDALVEANFRRHEVDAMSAWALGSIVVRNPQGTGADKTVSLGFAADRYEATAAWDAGGANAYERFLAFLIRAQDRVGTIEGAVMRLSTANAIQASAPQGVNAVPLTREQTRQRIEDQIGGPFRFVVIEDSHDIFNDGGTAYTRSKVWPAQQVAVIPSGVRVGSSYVAPVARAFEIARQTPGAGVDVRGQTVYSESGGNGRELTVECQWNALAIPDEQRVYVADAGV